MISIDSLSSERLQPRQIYCHGCSEFEFYLIVYSNCCRHVFKLAASKYEFFDSCKRVSGQILVSKPIQKTRNSFFPHLYHLEVELLRISEDIKPRNSFFTLPIRNGLITGSKITSYSCYPFQVALCSSITKR